MTWSRSPKHVTRLLVATSGMLYYLLIDRKLKLSKTTILSRVVFWLTLPTTTSRTTVMTTTPAFGHVTRPLRTV